MTGKAKESEREYLNTDERNGGEIFIVSFNVYRFHDYFSSPN